MLRQAQKALNPTGTPVSVMPRAILGHLQRKCDCSGSVRMGVMCAECQQKKHSGKPLQSKFAINEPGDVFEQEADRVADQVMRVPASGMKGDRLDPSLPLVQRRATGGEAGVVEAPPLVHDVLNSPGQPLDSATRAFFEPRFGHDFSQVRVHAGERAKQSASAVNAHAYTVGRNIVFGAGRFSPVTHEGRLLLAHELAHTVQQMSNGDPSSKVVTQTAPRSIQREEAKGGLDAKAKAIIAMAKDKSKTTEERAVEVVEAILKEYYPDYQPSKTSKKTSKIDSVNYSDAKAGNGLKLEEKFASDSKNEHSTGIIHVGSKFLGGVTETHFARRVLQVGHELEHINQIRTGLAGGHKQNKREFLAFYNEALAEEKPGTGQMSFATRLLLIDAALGYFYCLSADEQTDSESKKAELLKRREDVNGKAGNEPKDPPTSCKKQ